MKDTEKIKILKFLEECRDAQNKMFVYFWDNFHLITQCKNKLDINSLVNTIGYRVTDPDLKSHHHQQILQATFSNLKMIQTIIIKKIKFKMEDKELQRIYNYIAKFTFDWINLDKHIKKQLKSVKDDNYLRFLTEINKVLSDEKKYMDIKEQIEIKFYEIKDSFKCPVKKELQIQCNTVHTIRKIEIKNDKWIFMVDSNTRIGGTDRKRVFETIPIPVKFSKYHKEILSDKVLANTYNIKLNKYNKIEITGVYDVDIQNNNNELNDIVGLDIGLNKLITTSDGEIIGNNDKIVKKLKRLSQKEANRKRLQSHIRKKINDDSFELTGNEFRKQRNALLNFIKCDTRYRVKTFLKDRLNTHLVIEDLNLSHTKTWNKEVNLHLRRMHIQRIKDYLVAYSNSLGIKVSIVNPTLTSRQCSNCNFISKDNRKSQEKFSCLKCGYELNADINAAINILNRINYKEIKLDTPTWRVKEIITGKKE